VLFFISLATRRIEHVACTSNPDARWVSQQARNLIMQLGDNRPFRLLLHDRDAKFGGAYDEVFRSESIEVIRTPVRTPNANAYAERWVRTLRADCLDRILILGRRHLAHVLGVYRRHYNQHRPHRALELLPPDRPIPPAHVVTTAHVRRRDLLGGLIHEYKPPHEVANPASSRARLIFRTPSLFHERARIPDLPRRRQVHPIHNARRVGRSSWEQIHPAQPTPPFARKIRVYEPYAAGALYVARARAPWALRLAAAGVSVVVAAAFGDTVFFDLT
jgi:hypothetical protein